MTVLDAQAIVAFLVGEPAAPDVRAIFERRDDQRLLSAANLAEVIDILVRSLGHPEAVVRERLTWLEAGGVVTVDVDGDIGRSAGSLRARHYDRRSRPLSLGDCIALATALRFRHVLATSAEPLVRAALSEGCDVLPLPDTGGRRPAV